MYERTRSQGFGAEVKRRLMLGTYALSAGYYDAFYAKAQSVRHLIRQDFNTAFTSADVIALPTSPTPAFPLGERLSDPFRCTWPTSLRLGHHWRDCRPSASLAG